MVFPATKADIQRLEALIRNLSKNKGVLFSKQEKKVLKAALQFSACFINTHLSIREKIGEAISAKNTKDIFDAINKLVVKIS